MSDASPAGPGPTGRRFRFGLRGLLGAVLVLGVGFGWLAREDRRTREQAALIAELSPARVRVDFQKMTPLGEWVLKHLPRREKWLRDQIGDGWLHNPTIFTAISLEDGQISFVADRLSRLGTVREVLLQNPQLTERGLSRLRIGLPGVNIVPRDRPELHTYWRSETSRTHFAAGALAIDAALALGLLAVVCVAARSAVRRFRNGGDCPGPAGGS